MFVVSTQIVRLTLTTDDDSHTCSMLILVVCLLVWLGQGSCEGGVL